MLASPTEAPFDDPEHLFEPKWDGFRGLAFCDGPTVSLYSRTGRTVTDGYPEVISSLSSLGIEAVLDGELVVVDDSGVPRFHLMQQRNFASLPPPTSLSRFPVRYVAFDLCWLDGADLRERPLAERRRLLEELEGVETTLAVMGQGCALYDEVVRLGFEGVVAKHLASRYQPGARSRAWRKVKSAQVDRAIVVGFTQGTGGRVSTFGALVMAMHTEAGLECVGEVGTGFDDRTLAALRQALDQLVVDGCPVMGSPRIAGGVTWVEPGLVIQVEHRGWTVDRRLRAASFKGVPAGVDPSDVRRDSLL